MVQKLQYTDFVKICGLIKIDNKRKFQTIYETKMSKILECSNCDEVEDPENLQLDDLSLEAYKPGKIQILEVKSLMISKE
jgi:hypothetical protein